MNRPIQAGRGNIVPRATVVLLLAVAALSIAVPTQATHPGKNGKLAFVSERDGNVDVYVINADGSGETRLTTDPASDSNPTWSPDGFKIAFERTRDGDTEIYLMNADGSGQTPLTASIDGSWNPVWSPDGSKIAFESKSNGHTEIYVMNADGSGRTQLTTGPGDNTRPSWSPDGSRIAFGVFYEPQPHPDRIYLQLYIDVMNADGSGRTTLSGGDYASSPDWSPDGSKIAWAACGSPCGDLWIDVISAESRLLLASTQAGEGSEFFPDWAPDGSKIAYGHYTSVQGGLYTMNIVAGGQTTPLTSTFTDQQPRWSPDGSKIAFERGQTGIHVMNADGTGVTKLTNDGNDVAWQRIVFAFDGFYGRVANLPTFNRIHAGGIVPVLFSLGGNQGLDVLAAGSPHSTLIDCSSSANLGDVVPTEGLGLIYDGKSGQYRYLWKTDRRWAGTCRQLDVELADGTHHRANFDFR